MLTAEYLYLLVEVLSLVEYKRNAAVIYNAVTSDPLMTVIVFVKSALHLYLSV